MPVIPALGRLRQGHCQLKPSLGYRVRPCLKKMREREWGSKTLHTFAHREKWGAS
jgi:hypothetical protein